MNRWEGSGRLVSVNCRYTQRGKACCWACIAAQDDQDRIDYIDLVAWDDLGERLRDFGTVGDRIEITGKLHRRSYTTAAGTQQYKTEVVADSIGFIDRAPAKTAQEIKEGKSDG